MLITGIGIQPVFVDVPPGSKKIIFGKNIKYITYFNGPDLEEIVISKENEKYFPKDGVLYRKYLTTMWIYPINKLDKKFVINNFTRIYWRIYKTKHLE